MKLTKEVLEDFVSLSLGDDILPLIDILWVKKNVSEFKLAENLNITVNQVRNMLYRLGEYNLVSSTRKKDKRKGWYIYYWSLNEKSTFNAIWRFKQKKLQEFKDRVNREKDGILGIKSPIYNIDGIGSPEAIGIPKEHFTILEGVPENILEKCSLIANKIGIAVFESLGSQGTNIMIQNGLGAGQKVPHFAIEVVPRVENDGLNLTWEA